MALSQPVLAYDQVGTDDQPVLADDQVEEWHVATLLDDQVELGHADDQVGADDQVEEEADLTDGHVETWQLAGETDSEQGAEEYGYGWHAEAHCTHMTKVELVNSYDTADFRSDCRDPASRGIFESL